MNESYLLGYRYMLFLLGVSGTLGARNCTLSVADCLPGVVAEIVRLCWEVGSKRSKSMNISGPGPPVMREESTIASEKRPIGLGLGLGFLAQDHLE